MSNEKDIYCGIGPLPKGKRFGTMKECAALSQIRLYGKYKIDQKLIDSVQETKKLAAGTAKIDGEIEELMIKNVTIGGKLKKKQGHLKSLSSNVKDAEKKKILREDIDELKGKQLQIKEKLAKLRAMKDKKLKKSSKKTSKKSSKKQSRTKKSSKKSSKKGSRKTSKRRHTK